MHAIQITARQSAPLETVFKEARAFIKKVRDDLDQRDPSMQEIRSIYRGMQTGFLVFRCHSE